MLIAISALQILHILTLKTTLPLRAPQIALRNGVGSPIISFDSIGISCTRNVNMNSKSNASIVDLTATGTVSAASVAATGAYQATL